jgi:hypothetical protein
LWAKKVTIIYPGNDRDVYISQDLNIYVKPALPVPGRYGIGRCDDRGIVSCFVKITVSVDINPLFKNQVWARVLKGAWASLFRYEEADTRKPANGTDKGGREGLRERTRHLSL